MRLAVYLRNERFASADGFRRLEEEFLAGGCDLYRVGSAEDIRHGTDMLLSVGGDGTFLSAASVVGETGIPVLGVNFGRLGFLSENDPVAVCRAVLSGDYSIEKRTLLGFRHNGGLPDGIWPYALNEITVHRSGAATLGVAVGIDGRMLPTYWSDGLLVATSSGSTAYSLSVGGPIVLPDSKVLIISPIAPHNLNVRPLIVPDTSEIDISFRSRDAKVLFTADNRNEEIDAGTVISVSVARFSLNRVRLNKSDFIDALTSKLFWGEDIRNNER